VGHNRVARLMREVGIIGRTKRRYRVRTTDSNHDQPIAPNLLRDMPLPERPNQVWVSDITYIPTHEGVVSCRRIGPL
jgi:putative transposase